MDAKVKEIMTKLDCTEAEALEILADDDAIDHGADLFKLTPEQEKISKAARSVERKPAAQKVKRERKPDETKRYLIDMMRVLLEGMGSTNDIDVTNIERQIDFKVDDRKFRIVLSAPRK